MIKCDLSGKKMTDDGKLRKEKITHALFHNRQMTLLKLHFYAAVLPLLKEYIILFQVYTTE